MGIFDSMRKLTKKEKSKERMENIRESGKQGERNFERDNIFSKIKRVHHGADYEVTVRDSAGRERTEKHEVKRNNSPLSKLQKKTHGLKVDRYEKTPLGDVRKTYNRNGDELKKDPLTGKWNKVRKRDKSMLTSLFESNSSSKPKKTSSTKRKSTTKKSTIRKKPKSFSNADSLWGNTDSSKPAKKTTRRKSTTKKSKSGSNTDWFFGSSSSKSSGKKSKGSSNVDSIWGGSSSSKPTKRKSRKKSSGSSNVDKIWGSGSGKSFKW